jgi:hypothetical protein
MHQYNSEAQPISRIARRYRLGRHGAHSETRTVQAEMYQATRRVGEDGHVLPRSWPTPPPSDPFCSPPACDREGVPFPPSRHKILQERHAGSRILDQDGSGIILRRDTSWCARLAFSPRAPRAKLLSLWLFTMPCPSWDGSKAKTSSSSVATQRIGSNGYPNSQQTWSVATSKSLSQREHPHRSRPSTLEVRGPEDFDAAFEAVRKQRPDALIAVDLQLVTVTSVVARAQWSKPRASAPPNSAVASERLAISKRGRSLLVMRRPPSQALGKSRHA